MFYKFTPDLMTREDLEYISTGREETVANIVTKLQNATSNNLSAHVLLVGQRGIGKTHTLLQVYHKLKESGNFTAIRLSEEEYSVTSVEGLFKRILREMNVEFDENDIERTALDKFASLKAQKKFPVIFADNLQMLFKQIGDELPKLRSILQEYSPFCIVGSALSVFHEISSHDEPFYNFMEVIFLKGLDIKTMSALIKKRLGIAKRELLKDFEKHENRIRGIRILTGGNPRLTHMLCDILLQKGSLADLESNLLEMLDQLTPYYQVRMEQMPVTQRKIIDVLSQEKGPRSPTELAHISKMNVPSTVTQLRRLENGGVVEAIKFRDKKETSYQVTERLYRIWREMRSPIGMKRISLFVDFLKIWYTNEERYAEYIQARNRLLKLRINSQGGIREQAVQAEYILEAIPKMEIIKIRRMVQKFIVCGDYESAIKELKKMEEYGEQSTNPIIRASSETLIIIAKCSIARGFNKFGNLEMLTKSRDCAEEKLVEIAGNYKVKKGSAEQILLHEICHELIVDHERSDGFEKIEKLIDLSMQTHRCVICIANKATALRAKGRFKDALELLDAIPKKEKNSFSDMVEIRCLQGLDRMQDAKKIAMNLVNDGHEDLSMILGAIGTKNPNILLDIINAASNNLADLDKSQQGEKASKIVQNVVDYVAQLIIYGEGEIADMLFKPLEKLVRTYRIHIASVLVQPFKKLIASDKLEKTESLLDKFVKIDPSSEELLRPYNLALDYIKTEDPDILERIHKEHRELVMDVISQVSPNTKIAQLVRDSV